MMRRSLLTIAVVMVIVIGAGVADAGTLKMQNPGTNYRSSSGGEFGVDLISGTLSPALTTVGHGTLMTGVDFHTFCVEKDVTNLNFNTLYDYTLITSGLKTSTAALYSAWFTGSLPAYNYTAGSIRAADAAEFQTVLWYFQGGGEVYVNGSLDNTGATMLDYLDGTGDSEETVSTWSNGNINYSSSWSAQQRYWIGLGQYYADNGSGTYGTSILELKSGTTQIQNQLINTGGGLTEIPVVPLPSAAIAGLGMLGGLGLFYRLRRRRNVA